jgi:hypothetical protein
MRIPIRILLFNFDAEPDTTVNFDLDPDPTFYFDSDLDPAPIRVSLSATTGLKTLQFFSVRFSGSIVSLPCYRMSLLGFIVSLHSSRLFTLGRIRIPIQTWTRIRPSYFDADSDLTSQNNTDPDIQHCSQYIFILTPLTELFSVGCLIKFSGICFIILFLYFGLLSISPTGNRYPNY